MKWHIREYNNKTRQGLYIDIRDGKRRGTYQYNPEIPIDIYLQYFNEPTGSTIYRHTKTYLKQDHAQKYQKEQQQQDRYLKQLKQRGSLNTQLKQGTTSAVFDPNSATPQTVQETYRKLLGPLVLDKQLLDLVIQNAPKFKHRFTYTTTIHGTGANDDRKYHLATITDLHNRDILTFLTDYLYSNNRPILKGQHIDSDWKYNTSKQLQLNKDMIEHLNNGHITQTRTTVTFTRGK